MGVGVSFYLQMVIVYISRCFVGLVHIGVESRRDRLFADKDFGFPSNLAALGGAVAYGHGQDRGLGCYGRNRYDVRVFHDAVHFFSTPLTE